jgi:hypothetical protein
MALALLVLAVLGVIIWITVRTVKNRGFKAHTVCYGLAIIAGLFTYGYILSLDFPILLKVVASILLGIVLIIFGAVYQRHKQPGR